MGQTVIRQPHFDGIDNHSYWSNNIAKESFRNWMKILYPDVKMRTSEWCEMVNGSDVTMDSAYHLAQQIAEDLTILNVVSWQNWVGVAPGGYRDGLIYIDEASQKFRALKRLWGFCLYFVNTTVVTDPFEIVIGSSSVHSPSLTHSRSRASEVS